MAAAMKGGVLKLLVSLLAHIVRATGTACARHRSLALILAEMVGRAALLRRYIGSHGRCDERGSVETFGLFTCTYRTSNGDGVRKTQIACIDIGGDGR